MIVIIVVSMWFLLPAPALADEQQMPTINLPAVTVMNTPLASASLPKLTEPLLNTPQTIIEVPAQQAIDQGAFSMEDAVRYVPGVNIHANEDTSQRNQYYVRGFSAESDRYLDGMLGWRNVGAASCVRTELTRRQSLSKIFSLGGKNSRRNA